MRIRKYIGVIKRTEGDFNCRSYSWFPYRSIKEKFEFYEKFDEELEVSNFYKKSDGSPLFPERVFYYDEYTVEQIQDMEITELEGMTVKDFLKINNL